MDKNTQLYDISQHLLSGKTITSLQAISKYGCTRLSGKIFVLRNDYGYNIQSVMVDVINRRGKTVQVAQYSMTPDAIEAITNINKVTF